MAGILETIGAVHNRLLRASVNRPPIQEIALAGIACLEAKSDITQLQGKIHSDFLSFEIRN